MSGRDDLRMTWFNSPTRYGAVAVMLHWLMAALVAGAWLLGEFGDDFPRGGPRDAALAAHIMFGLAILIALLLRFAWRQYDRLPPAPATPLGRVLDRAAIAVHWLLYLLLAAVPIVGIVLQFARGGAVPVFGLFAVPSPWAADRAFAGSVKEVHELLANLLMIVAVLHAAAALIHHWWFRDTTLTRMIPRF